MSTIRGISVRSPLAFHSMSEGFGTYSLRHGGPIRLDPFINLDEFKMSQPTFPPHPHAGFSAVTYMFERSPGAFVNRDSLGDQSIIEPGALHWTQAAKGMMHEEVPQTPGVECHGLQMFVNLRSDHKQARPQAFHLSAQQVPLVSPATGVRLRLLAGEFETSKSPLTELLTPVLFADVSLDAGASAEIPAPAAHTAFALVLEGEGAVGRPDNATSVQAHDAVGFENDGDVLRLEGGRNGLRLLVCAGAPFNEPMVFGGPFVMNTAEQLFEAKRRFSKGEMGTLV
jgi:redox-sensitive bicupin YhaK (pirin superfamily)